MKEYTHPVRILILLENHIYPDDVRVKPHAESLAEDGYSVTVISPGGKNDSRYEIINGVMVYRYPANFAETTKLTYTLEFFVGTFFLTILPLWIWIKQGFDILLLYNPPDILWLSGILPKIFGKILVFDLRDLSPELFVSKFGSGNFFLNKMFLLMEHWSCRIANHIVVTNETTRKLLCERHGLPFENVTVIRQGPDIEKIALAPPDPLLCSRAEIIIGYLGNMSPERGIGNLLYALHHLKYDLGYNNWFCVLIGRQTAVLDLDQLAADLGIKESVWVTGYLPQDKWVSLLSTTDICVDPGASNPGNDVSTTNKMMDYMALGKPVVAFDLPERYGTAGDAALYVHSNDNFDLARQIAVLIDSPALRAKLGSDGYERILNHLAWHHQKKLLLTLFRQLTLNCASYPKKQKRRI